MDVPRLRPLQVGEILDAAIKIYRSHFGTLVKVVAVVVAPVQVLSAIVQVSVPSDTIVTTDQFTGETTFDAPSFIGTMVALLGTGLLGFIASQLATATSLKVISSSYLGETQDWRASLQFATARLGSLIWLAMITVVLGGLALLACIIPGIYLFVAWSVGIPALLLEDRRGLHALRRSRELVRGRWWPVLGCLVVSLLLGGIVSGAFQGVLTAITFGTDNVVIVAAASAVAGIASSVLVTPFTAGVVAVLYFDLRVRKEGFDLELLARSIGADPPVGGDSWPADDPSPTGAGGEQPPFWPPPPGWRPGG